MNLDFTYIAQYGGMSVRPDIIKQLYFHRLLLSLIFSLQGKKEMLWGFGAHIVQHRDWKNNFVYRSYIKLFFWVFYNHVLAFLLTFQEKRSIF